MKKIKSLIGAAVLAAGFATATAIPAQATTGGVVYNDSTEHEYITVTSVRPTCSTCSGTRWTITWGGQRSPSGFNVQGFYVGPSCNLYSQWGGLYAGGQWHYMSANNITLRLTAKCVY